MNFGGRVLGTLSDSSWVSGEKSRLPWIVVLRWEMPEEEQAVAHTDTIRSPERELSSSWRRQHFGPTTHWSNQATSHVFPLLLPLTLTLAG